MNILRRYAVYLRMARATASVMCGIRSATIQAFLHEFIELLSRRRSIDDRVPSLRRVSCIATPVMSFR